MPVQCPSVGNLLERWASRKANVLQSVRENLPPAQSLLKGSLREREGKLLCMCFCPLRSSLNLAPRISKLDRSLPVGVAHFSFLWSDGPLLFPSCSALRSCRFAFSFRAGGNCYPPYDTHTHTRAPAHIHGLNLPRGRFPGVVRFGKRTDFLNNQISVLRQAIGGAVASMVVCVDFHGRQHAASMVEVAVKPV